MQPTYPTTTAFVQPLMGWTFAVEIAHGAYWAGPDLSRVSSSSKRNNLGQLHTPAGGPRR